MHYTAMNSHINECPCYCQYCTTVVEKDDLHRGVGIFEAGVLR